MRATIRGLPLHLFTQAKADSHAREGRSWSHRYIQLFRPRWTGLDRVRAKRASYMHYNNPAPTILTDTVNVDTIT